MLIITMVLFLNNNTTEYIWISYGFICTMCILFVNDKSDMILNDPATQLSIYDYYMNFIWIYMILYVSDM